MDPLSILLGAGLGGIKSIFDSNRRTREQKLAGETARYSPWTGMQPKEVHWENPFQDVVSGGLSGLAIGQSMARNDKLNALLDKMIQNPTPEETAVNIFAQKPALDESVWTQLGRKGNYQPLNMLPGMVLS